MRLRHGLQALSLVMACALGTQSANATPLELTHQLRLTDAVGTALNGETPLTVTLWSDSSSVLSPDKLWEVSLMPDLQNGYATLILDDDGSGGTIDSGWFANDVWIELTVDGTTMTPRNKVRDVPGATGASVLSTGKILMTGPDLAAHPSVTAGAGTAVYDSSTGYVTLSGWPTRFDPLLTIPLIAAGELPAGTPARIQLFADYQCTTTDCDLVFELTDGSGRLCHVAPGDNDQYWVLSSNGQSETNIGWPRASNNEQLVWNILLQGAGNGTLFSSYSQRPDNGGQPRWMCAADLRVEEGITLKIVGDHTPEVYQIYMFEVGVEATPSQ